MCPVSRLCSILCCTTAWPDCVVCDCDVNKRYDLQTVSIRSRSLRRNKSQGRHYGLILITGSACFLWSVNKNVHFKLTFFVAV
jgi:hypothetical protein